LKLEPDYSTTYLLPPCVEDWVGPDHPARFIREYVDSMELSEMGIVESTSEVGRPSYSGSVLLKLWFYGYFMRQRSTRKLEAVCRDSMGAIWLLGGLPAPDHNTIWRFWKANRKLIEKLFVQSVKVAYKVGLVAMVVHALDGTKILAASSRHSAWHQKDLKKILAKLDTVIEEIARQIEEAQSSDVGSFKLELSDAKERRQAIEQALQELQAHGSPEHLHPLETEAKQMMGNRGRIEWAYNCQAVVDDKASIVVAADLSDCPNDDHNLVVMVEQAKANTGDSVDYTLADASYGHSEQELALAEPGGHSVVTSRPKAEEEPYHASKFEFDREKRTLVCPQGQPLNSNGSEQKLDKDGQPQTFFSFCCRNWKSCPMAEQCCNRTKEGKLRGRIVSIGPHYEAAMRQRQKVTREVRKELMCRRMATVEPLFGRLKWQEGFTRFSFRGKEKAKAQWEMITLTSNLRVLMKHWKTGELRFSSACKDEICLVRVAG
jgi:transposase